MGSSFALVPVGELAEFSVCCLYAETHSQVIQDKRLSAIARHPRSSEKV
ncbi:MAG: hypothetical protein JGK12_08935 [Microcoleus sp. PH2017_01_SCD_O_A]|nr:MULTISPECIES: hypothetical protein [unclassified Microcoleus]MCC3411697.1 hypothetical protein [Microcoleus sp. PH2017_02_FOX_O_A]MCC3416589.1 hypothetical protein [Microcoleus sp. PH2017_07_MST_O_A]MCC3440611.1 hypothetical protein [Microcoleus sp. PH2017_03_ELD_O_A]MCC3465573.1 hypothetical protein [Microcoleus sp. PH2017_06_SFM_O_A]MCC3489507.1 hypothetical protein [Microcoleus sp. PH2017_16_JOR_D_A]MCC3532986.1 hypothetical protein [Microcoleus sp. PH2017_25_DOB_D_A]